MRATIALIVVVWLSASTPAEEPRYRLAPAYSASTLVNSASNQPGPLAPNTIATLYGTELAFVTRALQGEDIRNGALPTILPGTGVRLLVNSLAAQIYFVSPRQVNLLIPAILKPGPAELQLVQDGRAGPLVRFTLSEAAPSLYLQSENLAIAVSPEGALYSRPKPARPGDWIVLYCTGLGPVRPAAGYGDLAVSATPLVKLQEFGVLLNDFPIDPSRIAYAGLSPGFAGLYQINLQLPRDAPADPEIRIVTGSVVSPPGVRLPVGPL
jgi:uncharacterized protein (TIGR03437 family)